MEECLGVNGRQRMGCANGLSFGRLRTCVVGASFII